MKTIVFLINGNILKIFLQKMCLIVSAGYEIYQAYNESFRVSPTTGNEKLLTNGCFKGVAKQQRQRDVIHYYNHPHSIQHFFFSQVELLCCVFCEITRIIAELEEWRNCTVSYLQPLTHLSCVGIHKVGKNKPNIVDPSLCQISPSELFKINCI